MIKTMASYIPNITFPDIPLMNILLPNISINNLYLPTAEGYELYRAHIHNHFWTGIAHGVFMPIVTVGFFMIFYGLSRLYTKSLWESHTNTLSAFHFIVGFLSCGYFQYDPWYGLITVLFYWVLVTRSIDAFEYRCSPWHNIYHGVTMMGFGLFIMEFGSHWYLENHASNLYHFVNSVYHTPLYGTKSILNAIGY